MIITITDITRMAPPFLCVAGINEEGSTVRVILERSRIDQAWLFDHGQLIIYPFAKVDLHLFCQRSLPPHTEDWIVNQDYKRSIGQVGSAEQRKFLTSILDHSVADIFGSEISHDHGYFVRSKTGNRSLGTVRTKVFHASYACYEGGNWDYRLVFDDMAGGHYSLKIVDFTFCNYADYLRDKENLSCEEISDHLTHRLRHSETYLRVGLARGWANYPERCYLQVTGIFSYPDYLDGHRFADFVSPQTKGVYKNSGRQDHVAKESPPVDDQFVAHPANQVRPVQGATINQVVGDSNQLAKESTPSTMKLNDADWKNLIGYEYGEEF